MPCYDPVYGYMSTDGGFTTSVSVGYKDRRMAVPCGRCVGCRLKKSREWAVRCSHEAAFHKQNCFITLTFDDDNLPFMGSLDVSHPQLFMKRLRQYFARKFGIKSGIRVYYSGEYGTKFDRPHYHLIVFGVNFDHDKYLFSRTSAGSALYRSPSLESLWPFGFSSVGDVTFESAGYVARYTMKKVCGEQAKDYYARFDVSTGEVFHLKPEFSAMSRDGGVGLPWIKQYLSDVYPSDFIVYNGFKLSPPRFYDNYLEKVNPELYFSIKEKRISAMIASCDFLESDKAWLKLGVHNYDSTPDRLLVRNECHLSRSSSLVRSLV